MCYSFTVTLGVWHWFGFRLRLALVVCSICYVVFVYMCLVWQVDY